MSDTKLHSTPDPKKKENGSKAAGYAATAATAAGIGAAGAAMAMNHIKNDDNHDDNHEGDAIFDRTPEQNQAPEQDQPTDAPIEETIEVVADAPVEQPAATTTGQHHPVNGGQHPIDGPEPITDPIVEPTPTPDIPTNGPSPVPGTDEVVINPVEINPENIADAIIAENLIDANDMDDPDVINFDEVTTIYAINGESGQGVVFHDNMGNQMAMIDIDNDNHLDMIVTDDGRILVDENDEVIVPPMTLDDVELNLSGEQTYLAADDNLPNNDLDPSNDIITT